MKRTILFYIALAASLATTMAQRQYQPISILSADYHWREAYADLVTHNGDIDTGNVYYYDAYFNGDSITIDSITYKILVCKILRTNDSMTYGMREDSLGRVYIYRYGQNDRKIYDFSLHKGDTVWKTPHSSGGYTAEIVHSVDTTFIAGKYRKVISFALRQVQLHRRAGSDTIWDTIVNDYTPYTEDMYPAKIWIEGIGSYGGLVTVDVIDHDFNEDIRLLCSFSDGTENIHYGPFDCIPRTYALTTPESAPRIAAYPNPANERVTLEFGEARFHTLRLINAAGATVLQLPLTGHEPQLTLQLKGMPKGIYSCILSGKDGTATEKIVVE
ncbi:MAG: T9SS type A sorting domain-containing protein [Bacteroidales bacterium]|nr:T9SS type A sorting domain-containing protein [Bacteroidales bacterium]